MSDRKYISLVALALFLFISCHRTSYTEAFIRDNSDYIKMFSEKVGHDRKDEFSKLTQILPSVNVGTTEPALRDMRPRISREEIIKIFGEPNGVEKIDTRTYFYYSINRNDSGIIIFDQNFLVLGFGATQSN